MKMLMLVYSGNTPERISGMLDDCGGGGYTQFHGVHGAGSTGRREGSRAWPGKSTLFVSVIPEDTARRLFHTLHEESTRLPPGERLHVAILPTESFF